jgi:hypothetical protein
VCKAKPGRVVHTSNPSYSGGRNQEDYGSKSAWGKKFLRPPLSQPIKVGCDGVFLSFQLQGTWTQENQEVGQPRHKCKTLFKSYLNYLNQQNPLFLPINAYTLSTTKLEIRGK